MQDLDRSALAGLAAALTSHDIKMYLRAQEVRMRLALAFLSVALASPALASQPGQPLECSDRRGKERAPRVGRTDLRMSVRNRARGTRVMTLVCS